MFDRSVAQKYMQVAEGLKLKARRSAEGEITFAVPQAELAAFLAKHQKCVDAGAEVQLTGHFDRRYTAQIWKLLQTAPHQLDDVQRARLAGAEREARQLNTVALVLSEEQQ